MALVGLEVLRFHVALGISHTRVDGREHAGDVLVEVQQPMRVCCSWAKFYFRHIDCNGRAQGQHVDPAAIAQATAERLSGKLPT